MRFATRPKVLSRERILLLPHRPLALEEAKMAEEIRKEIEAEDEQEESERKTA